MIRAESKATTSRRGFLARGAATVAAASLLATPALTSPAGADPILDAIEKHKVARAALSAAVHEHDHHEDEHTERVVDLAHDAETDAACTLVSIKATTSAGLVALLRYEMWGTSHFAMPRDRNDFSFGDLVNCVGPHTRH